MKWIYMLLAMLAVAGCKSLKEQQVGAYIGDTQTKTFGRNTTELHNSIPKERQILFGSMDEAMKAGYTSAQEGGGEGQEDGQ
jgi:hypothetical protein